MLLCFTNGTALHCVVIPVPQVYITDHKICKQTTHMHNKSTTALTAKASSKEPTELGVSIPTQTFNDYDVQINYAIQLVELLYHICLAKLQITVTYSSCVFRQELGMTKGEGLLGLDRLFVAGRMTVYASSEGGTSALNEACIFST